MKSSRITIILFLLSFYSISTFADNTIRVFGLSDKELISELKAQTEFYLQYFEINRHVIVSVVFSEFDESTKVGNLELKGTTVHSLLDGKDILHIVIEKNMSDYKKMLILAHEMTHAKQYLKGELFDYQDDNHISWHGLEYTDVKNIPYNEREWESEAMFYETKLYRLYLKNKKQLMAALKNAPVKNLLSSADSKEMNKNNKSEAITEEEKINGTSLFVK